MRPPAPGSVDVTRLRLDVSEFTRRGGLLDQLEALLPEPIADPTTGTSTHHKVTGSPAPWHPEAADVLMTVHAGARTLEDQLRATLGFDRDHTSHAQLLLRPRRGGHGEHGPFRPIRIRVQAGPPGTRGASTTNTRRALAALPDLAAAAGDPHTTATTAQVQRWCQTAREVRDIDEAERWVPVPRPPKAPPPACPYCHTFALRMRPRCGEVRCTNPGCTDPDGQRPKARVLVGAVSGVGVLEFRDGAQITFADPCPGDG